MSVAFLAGRQESGAISELLRSIPDGIGRLVEVLDNTVNKRGGKEYDYGVSASDSYILFIQIIV